MGHKPDPQKARFWRKAVRDAARSGLSIREFCRQRKLPESQFYWWQHNLASQPRGRSSRTEQPASLW
jgi:hypothetical protein